MKAKTIMPQTFREFYDVAPKEIQDIIDKSKTTAQTLAWHPEKWVYTHINVVFNRAKRTGDINMILAAFFHDLGKVSTTKKHATIPNKWSAHGHEKVSAQLVTKYRDWVEEMGGDYVIVHYIVYEHMRVQQLDDMRPSKRKTFMDHKYADKVIKFSEMDDMQKDYSNDLDDDYDYN